MKIPSVHFRTVIQVVVVKLWQNEVLLLGGAGLIWRVRGSICCDCGDFITQTLA
jgi:hypothetical protein